MQRLQNVTTTFALFYTIIRWQWPYFTPKAIMTIAGSMGIISSWRREKQLIYRCMDKSRFKYSYACWKQIFHVFHSYVYISFKHVMIWSGNYFFQKHVPDAKTSHSDLSCKEERLHEKYFGTTKTRKGTKYHINVPSLPPSIYEKFQAVRDKVRTTKGLKDS